MSQQANYAAQAIEMDFCDEVPYAFDYCPENKRLNDEMFKRAVECAKQKKLNQQERKIP